MNDLDYKFYLDGHINGYITIPTYDMSSGRYVDGKGWIPTDDVNGGPKNKSFNLDEILYIHKLEELNEYDKDATFLQPQCECSILKTSDGRSWYVKGNCEKLKEQIKEILTRYHQDENRFETEFHEFEKKFKSY